MADIEVTRADAIATVTINRPHRKNAVTGDMWAQLAETFRSLSADADIRCVVITGAGGEFCSGADLAAREGSGRPVHQLAAMRSVNDAALALHRMPQPTIAKVRGVAVGAGCNSSCLVGHLLQIQKFAVICKCRRFRSRSRRHLHFYFA